VAVQRIQRKFGAGFPLNEEMVSCEASAFSIVLACQVMKTVKSSRATSPTICKGLSFRNMEGKSIPNYVQ